MKQRMVCLGFVAAVGVLMAMAAQCPTQPAATPTIAPTVAPTKAATPALELVGASTKSFTLDEVKALPATEGFAGIKSSTGKITPPVKFKGVALDKLCEQVGGLGADQGVNVVAKDGYAMTLSYDQITKGDFITYDPGTGDEVKIADPLKVVIAYEMDGKPLNEEMDGTLRLVVVSAKNNQVVDGHWSVKWVTQVAIKSLAQEWTLQIEGAITEKMDRGTFESCSAPGCHGVTWKDDKAQEWKGVPLWLLVGRADDEVKHGTGAFNEKLADQGYQVDVVAADGYKATLDSARLKRNNNIIVANTVNDNPLDDKNFPLRLVGADLQNNEMAGQVAKIVLHLTAPVAPTPAPTPTQPAATPTTAPAAGKSALTVAGAVEKELSLTLDQLEALGVVKITAEHPKKGQQEYEGVRLSVLLDQAKVKAGAKTLVFTAADGYTAEVSLADAQKCADCLVAIADGKLSTVMPGMQSNAWVKDLVKIEVK